MECRKARYCLVVSFDGTLDAAAQKELSYHLKDCRDCRHEAFYYRELFSAERQLREESPSPEFNERLVAEIRLREARAAWPEAQQEPKRLPRFRWQLVAGPALFAAAAAVTFIMVLPEPPTPGGIGSERMTASTSRSAIVAPTTVEPEIRAQAALEPRYSVAPKLQTGHLPTPIIFRMPDPGRSRFAEAENPFSSLVRAGNTSLADYRSRQRTRYVLPVVTHAATQERVY